MTKRTLEQEVLLQLLLNGELRNIDLVNRIFPPSQGDKLLHYDFKCFKCGSITTKKANLILYKYKKTLQKYMKNPDKSKNPDLRCSKTTCRCRLLRFNGNKLIRNYKSILSHYRDTYEARMRSSNITNTLNRLYDKGYILKSNRRGPTHYRIWFYGIVKEILSWYNYRSFKVEDEDKLLELVDNSKKEDIIELLITDIVKSIFELEEKNKDVHIKRNVVFISPTLSPHFNNVNQLIERILLSLGLPEINKKLPSFYKDLPPAPEFLKLCNKFYLSSQEGIISRAVDKI